MPVFQYDVAIRDAKGKTGHFRLFAHELSGEFPTVFDMENYAQRLATKLDAIIDGQITGLTVSIMAALPDGLKTAPLPNSDREEGVMFYWRTTNNITVHTRVPTFSEDFLVPEGFLIDPVPTEVSDFFFLVTRPEELSLVISPSSDRGEDIVDSISERAQESFRST